MSRHPVPAFLAAAAVAAGLAAHPVAARVSPEQAAELGGERLTCVGAERAGSASGVAAYSGQWLGGWPGLKSATGYDPGPYADEQPLFVISATNMAQHAERLTDGQKALLKKYPQAYRIPVYPSRRDFRPPDWVCDTIRLNATSAELTHNGLGSTQRLGAIGFPFPQNGLEALHNIKKGSAAFTQSVTYSSASVYSNGSIAWGKVRLKLLLPWARPGLDPRPTARQEPVESYFLYETLLPERDRGLKSAGTTPNDYSQGELAPWVYQPGLRRVRQAQAVPPDYPVPPAGLHTVDDEHLFNGSPERFDWKLLGKREIYIPYHNFRVNDPALRYGDIVKPGALNPDYQRYELHRVWVVEGRLKPGIRHVYSRRVLYADEDSWLPVWSDTYDGRGLHWRANYILYFYAPSAQVYHRGVTVYHDLAADAYEATYLVNESGEDGWKFNDASLTPAMFAPGVLAQRSH